MLGKTEVLREKAKLISWLDCQLRSVEEHIWHEPLKIGKWSIAAVVAHFIAWDEFVIKKRLPYLLSGEAFPYDVVDIEVKNREAAMLAASGIHKDALLDECKKKRNDLLFLLERLPAERFESAIQIGDSVLSMQDYWSGLIDHDRHHINEINRFLLTKGAKIQE